MKKLNSPLALALLISLAVHAVPLSVRIVAPQQFNRVFKDTALEVILVNAQSQERPEHAQAIAQANLAGGGDVAQGRATSPMPYSALTRIGDDFEERQRQIDAVDIGFFGKCGYGSQHGGQQGADEKLLHVQFPPRK